MVITTKELKKLINDYRDTHCPKVKGMKKPDLIKTAQRLGLGPYKTMTEEEKAEELDVNKLYLKLAVLSKMMTDAKGQLDKENIFESIKKVNKQIEELTKHEKVEHKPEEPKPAPEKPKPKRGLEAQIDRLLKDETLTKEERLKKLDEMKPNLLVNRYKALLKQISSFKVEGIPPRKKKTYTGKEKEIRDLLADTKLTPEERLKKLDSLHKKENKASKVEAPKAPKVKAPTVPFDSLTMGKFNFLYKKLKGMNNEDKIEYIKGNLSNTYTEDDLLPLFIILDENNDNELANLIRANLKEPHKMVRHLSEAELERLKTKYTQGVKRQRFYKNK